MRCNQDDDTNRNINGLDDFLDISGIVKELLKVCSTVS